MPHKQKKDNMLRYLKKGPLSWSCHLEFHDLLEIWVIMQVKTWVQSQTYFTSFQASERTKSKL